MITILFDTETTGLLNPSANALDVQPEIIEIYVIKLDNEFNIIGEFESFLKPKYPISEKITEITGITNEMVADAPKFASIYFDLAKMFVGVDRMVGHNLAFDRSMVANELLRIDKLLYFPWPMDHYCTVQKSMGIEQRRLTLDKLHRIATGKGMQKQHRAKDDVYALVRCYHYLIERKV